MAIIGIVQGITGTITGITANGEQRQLNSGDTLSEGEQVITALSSTISIELTNGEIMEVPAGSQLTMTSNLLTNSQNQNDNTGETGDDDTSVLLSEQGDPTENLPAPSAGDANENDLEDNSPENNLVVENIVEREDQSDRESVTDILEEINQNNNGEGDGESETDDDGSFFIPENNLNAPTIDTAIANSLTEENVISGDVVAIFRASDLDGNQVSYSLTSGNEQGFFTIDDRGVVRLTQEGADAINNDIGIDLTQLSLGVTASDGERSSPESQVLIDITRVNDNTSTIDAAMGSGVTENNLAVGDVVAQFTASDLDNDDSISFSLSSGNEQGYFSIDAVTGDVTLTQVGVEAINSDVGIDLTQLSLGVTASDGSRSSSESVVQIDITRVNDNAPTIDTASGNTVTEGAIIVGDVVANVRASDLDDNDNVTFRLSSGNDQGYFSIDVNTGVVSLTQAAVDAINSDAGVDLTALTVGITASDGTRDSAETEVTVDINRVNDNAPTIDTSSGSAVTENTVAAGDLVATFTASDLDDTDNVSFSLTSGNSDGYFSIDPVSGEVRLTQAGVDAINNDTSVDLTELTLGVAASDGTKNSAEIEATINISRVNDNAPTIDAAAGSSITENSITAGDVVANFRASDLDDLDNVSFSLISGNEQDYFSLDSNTGMVSLTQAGVDAISSDEGADLTELTLRVIASDGERNSAETEVIIDITRVNDNAPTIDTSAGSAITENSIVAGDVVATFTASDLDDMDSVRYSLSSGNSQGYFSIDENSGEVRLTQAGADAINSDVGLDLTALTLGVTVSDGVRSSTETEVTIDITRVNDNAPTIDTSVGSTITENSIAVGDVVATFTASDLDDANSVSYHLTSGNALGYFSIDENSGEVRLTQTGVDAINSDTGVDLTALTLGVTASDGVRSSTEAEVTIDITRVNDNAPTIDASAGSEITENSIAVGDRVAMFTASDLDDADNVSYSLTSGNAQGYFSIDESTGEVTLTQAGVDAINSDIGVDLTALTLGVTASDGVRSSSETEVTIDITRMNDNAPTIDTSEGVTITEGAIVAGDVVATFTASDLDDADSVSYSLSSGNEAGYFSINVNTGEVSLTQAGVDAINSDAGVDLTALTLGVTASDGSRMSSETLVVVDITRVNDNAPTIDTAEGSSVTENAIAEGDLVASFTASDLDDTDSISYSISSGNDEGYFNIGESDGEVRLTQAGVNAINSDIGIDLTELTLGVTASDGVRSSAESRVTIDITRVNDNAPIIDTSEEIDLTEGTLVAGDLVATFSASDLDDSDSVSYSLTSGNEEGYFSIDASTGRVSLTQMGVDAINSDEGTDLTSLMLGVTASDGTRSSSESQVTVDITRTNDNAPTIDTSAGSSITENSVAEGDLVASFRASDLDDTDNVSYSLTSGNDQGYFSIDGTTGDVRLTQVGVDAVNSDAGVDLTSLTLGVTVSDGVRSSTETQVSVDITRVNDSAPVIDTTSSNNLTESAIAAGDTVATVTASDLDDVDNIDYSLTSGNEQGYFLINEGTGEVTLTQAGVDAINSDIGVDLTQFILGVTASDGAHHSDEIEITVDVTRVNDNAPVIDAADGSEITEGAVSAGDLVATFTASDLDDADNVSYSLTMGNEHGYFSINENTGEVRLTQAGVDAVNNDGIALTALTIGVTASDGRFDSGEMTTTIDVTRINDNAPVISDTASLSTAEDTALTITTADLLTHASDLDGDTLHIENLTAENGTITDNGDNSWTFTPTDNYSGDVVLNYDVSDGEFLTAASALVTVTPAPDTPDLVMDLSLIGQEDSEISLNINAALTDTDGSETLSVVISEVPDGVSLSAGVNNDDGSWTLTSSDLENLILTPVPDFSGSIPLTVTAISTDNETGATASLSELLQVNVIPVADVATIAVNNDVYSDLVLDTDLIDNGEFSDTASWDMSGTVDINNSYGVLLFGGGSVASDGVAEQAIQSHPDINYSFSLDYRKNGDSTVSGRADIIDEQSGEILASQTFSTNSTSHQTLNLDFAGISSGNVIIRISDTSGHSPSKDLWVDNVSLEASSSDNPNLHPRIEGVEDESIALDLGALVTDSDGSEVLSSVALSDIPADIIVSDGAQTVTSMGTAIDVTGWDLAALTLTPPENNNIDFTLQVSAVSTEQTSGTSTTTTQMIDVHIAATADAASIGGENLGIVSEDAVLTASGNLTIDDADEGEAFFVPETITSNLGSLVIDAAGAWTYTVNNSAEAIQSLGEGDTLSDFLTIRSLDGTEHDIEIAISGTNDIAMIRGMDTVPQLNVDDFVIPDSYDQVISSQSGQNTLGANLGTSDSILNTADTVKVHTWNGNWRRDYVMPDDEGMDGKTVVFQSGAEWNSYIHFEGKVFTLSMGNTVLFKNQGGKWFNDREAAALDEDSGASLQFSGVLTVDDQDTGEGTFTPDTVSGTYGSLSINESGNWTYSADNSQTAIQSLSEGDTLTDTITIQSADGTTHDITITISGQNDAPILSAEIFTTAFDINENETLSISLPDNAFTDVDAGDQLTYSLKDNAPDWLTIDPATGDITGTPDDNDVGLHTVTIVATDSVGEFAESDFEINVLNTNSAPQIASVLSLGNDVLESTGSNTIVGRVSATDEEGHTLIYELIDDADGRFIVDHNTGDIRIAPDRELDYETADSHTVRVRVTDEEGLSTEQEVVLQVLDVNEAPSDLTLDVDPSVAPSLPDAQISWGFDNNSLESDAGGSSMAGSNAGFVAGPNNQFSGAVEFNGTGSVSAAVNVSESEFGVSFWFKADNNGGLFQIEGSGHDRNIWLNNNGQLTARLWQSGNIEEITTETGTDYSDGQWHHLTYTYGSSINGQKLYVDGNEVASGSMDHSGFDWQTTIRLGYSSMGGANLDGAIAGVQVFDQAITPDQVAALMADVASVDAVIDEDATESITIGTLSVTDPDLGTFGEHSYTVSDDRFDVVNGHLKLKADQALDHETEDVISVSVTATDESGNGLSTTQVFNILVKDVNEAPVISDEVDLGSSAEDSSFEITEASLLVNSTDVDGDHLSIQNLSSDNGIVADNGNGTWTFTPTENFSGIASFDFDVTDGLTTSSGTASLTVTAVTDAPAITFGQVIAEDSFNSGSDGWNQSTTSSGNFNSGNMLGRFAGTGGNEAVYKTFDVPEGVSEVTLQFTFYEIDSWDNEQFTLFVDGQPYHVKSYHLGHTNSGTEIINNDQGAEIGQIEHGAAFHAGFTGWVDQAHAYTLTIPVEPDAGSVQIGFGSTTNESISNESWGIDNVILSAAGGQEDSAINLDINTSTADTDGSEILAITINNVPEGASLSAGTDNGNGSWSLTPSELQGLTLTPPVHFSGTIALTVNTTSTESTSGESVTTSKVLPLSVSGVADVPVISSSIEETETQLFSEDIGSSVGGWNVSGTHWSSTGGGRYYRMMNDDSVATRTIDTSTDASYELTLMMTGNFAVKWNGEVIQTFSTSSYDWTARTITLPAVDASTADLEIEVISGQVRFDSGELKQISAPVDTPEDTAIDLDLNVALADMDGSESLQLKLAGVPVGATISDGSNSVVSTGDSIDISDWDYNAISLLPPENESGHYDLTLTATSSENGTESSSTLNIALDVTSVNDAPVAENIHISGLTEVSTVTLNANDFGTFSSDGSHDANDTDTSVSASDNSFFSYDLSSLAGSGEIMSADINFAVEPGENDGTIRTSRMLTFDDQGVSQNNYRDVGTYHEFSFTSNMDTIDTVGSSWNYGATSGDFSALNNNGGTGVVTIEEGKTFTFDGVDTRIWGSGSRAGTIEGYKDGTLVWSKSVTLGTTYQSVSGDTTEIDTLKFNLGNFFLIDSLELTAIERVVNTDGYQSDQGVESVVLWDADDETGLSSSGANSEAGIAIYNDLESGIEYGSANVTGNNNQPTSGFSVGLNDSAKEALNNALAGDGIFKLGASSSTTTGSDKLWGLDEAPQAELTLTVGAYQGQFVASDQEDNENLTFNILSQPGKGTVINNGDGTFTLVKGSDFDSLGRGESEDITFTYEAVDSNGLASAPATVTISVSGSNDGPDAADNSLLLSTDSIYTFSTDDFNFEDIDTSDTLHSITITSLPAYGSLTLNGNPVVDAQEITANDIPNLIYTAPTDEPASSTGFGFIVSDGKTSSSEHTFSVNVKEFVSAGNTNIESVAIDFQSSLDSYSSLVTFDKSNSSSEFFSITDGFSGNWGITGTQGGNLLGIWGGWGSRDSSWTGDGDSTYSSFKFENSPSQVTFNAMFREYYTPDVTFYGFKDGVLVSTVSPSFSQETRDGLVQHTARDITFSGIDEIRFNNSDPFGVDNFQVEYGATVSDNLLTNASAESGTSGWNIISSGGSGWGTSGASHDDNGTGWTTSYNWTKKSQTIDLVAKGFSEDYLDTAPTINISDWFKQHVYGGDTYYLKVEIRGENNNVLASYHSGTKSATGSWQEASNTFEDYGEGARYIYFEHGGNDGEYWSGRYGTAIDDSEVVIALESNPELIGTENGEIIVGTSGSDVIRGEEGADTLTGYDGGDSLIGGEGDDILIGGAGDDTLTGGAGSDHYVWNLGDEGTTDVTTIDTITDFTVGSGGDVLDIKDLLVDESENSIGDYLDLTFNNGNTEIEIKPTGTGAATQKIILENVDLSSLGSEADALNQLLNDGNLSIDH